MIETSGLLAEQRLERANDRHEQRSRSEALERFGEFQVTCSVIHGCGRIEEPGQKFEERIDGFICSSCIERELEAENLEPGSTTAMLIDWWDKALDGLVLTREDLRHAIEVSADREGYDGRWPWESEAEFDIRRHWGAGTHEAIHGELTAEDYAAADALWNA